MILFANEIMHAFAHLRHQHFLQRRSATSAIRPRHFSPLAAPDCASTAKNGPICTLFHPCSHQIHFFITCLSSDTEPSPAT